MSAALEKHFSIPEIAKLWGYSIGTVRKLFRDRQDVLHFGTGEGRHKRGYFSIRIPESVMQRVHDDLKKSGR